MYRALAAFFAKDEKYILVCCWVVLHIAIMDSTCGNLEYLLFDYIISSVNNNSNNNNNVNFLH